MNFITIDFETAKYSQESACSVGLVRFENGEAVDTFYSLIRPPSLYIRPDFTDIHGLTVDDVKDAPTFAELWDSNIKSFIGYTPLGAHNAVFDMGVLKATSEWYGLPVPQINFFCTLAIARRTWTRLESHALTKLGENFGIIYDAHNALSDALTCGKIVCLAAQELGCSNLKELLKTVKIRTKKL